MFRNVFSLSFLLLLAAPLVQAAQVDLKKSEVIWTGKKIVGEEHSGIVKLKSADLKMNKGGLTSANIVIDMTTIKNTDIKNKKMSKKLVDHLKSADFFATDKFKTSRLMVQKVAKASAKAYLLTGKLEIKGKSEPLKLKAKVIESKPTHDVVEAKFSFDRTKYGIKYGSGSFFTDLGDKMIEDIVDVKVKLHVLKDKKAS